MIFLTRISTLFIFLLMLSSQLLFALHRDYKSDCDEELAYQNYYYPYCLEHAPDGYPDWISPNVVKLIPKLNILCKNCSHHSIYLGYIDPDFRKYRSHFLHQLDYCSHHKTCKCYWPEYSSNAAKINDSAYLLFRDLITTTALSDLLEDKDKQKKFIENPGWFLNKHGLILSFIVQQFRFSDYYHICKDLENYALAHYRGRDAAQIKDKLEDIVEALYPKFFTLYTTCFTQHPHADIEQEIQLMKLLANDISGLENRVTSANTAINPYYDNGSYDVSELIIHNLTTAELSLKLENKEIQTQKNFFAHSIPFDNFLNSVYSQHDQNLLLAIRSFSVQSEILLEQGSILNSLLLYQDAIKILSQALEYNSSNRDAYIERAMAYFETNQIKLALKDYEKASKLIIPPFENARAYYIPKDKIDFAEGLITGILQGSHVSVKEFIPSTLSCCRGILQGLWAFVTSPSDISQEMINTTYAIGEFINTHDAIDCLKCVVPEINELSLTWHKLNDYSKGKQIGYIIGKYGVDIFAPLGAIKGINKLRALKRANTWYTLENCAISQTKRTKILEKSAKKATARESVIKDAAKKGKILTKNSNVPHHVMQKKHAWDKLIELSGNIEEDFAKIIDILEEHHIADKTFLIGEPRLLPEHAPKISKTIHEKIINNCHVHVEFETYIDTNVSFLQDAWVVTK